MPSFGYEFDGRVHNVRIGAWFLNSGVQRIPICYTGYLSEWGNNGYDYLINQNSTYNDQDDQWMVSPGYKLVIFEHSLDTTPNYTLDNTNGTTVLSRSHTGSKISDMNKGVNNITSFRLYYKGQEVKHPNNAGL